jgi:hypothetical protein
VTDVRALRALAHPDRLAIHLLLLADGPRTATECAEVVGATPSACSYHLRQLERFELVERVPGDTVDDARTRPWRSTAVGFTLGDWSDDSAEGRAARHAIGLAELAENDRLTRAFIASADELDPEWQEATELHTYALAVTPEELGEINAAVDALLRPYRSPVRAPRPPAARTVHVTYHAFPRADLP